MSEQRVAYLILSFHKPELVESLASRIIELSSNAEVVVHHDAKASEMPWNGKSPDERIHLIDRMTIEWGDWSQVEGFLRLITYAHEVLDAEWFCFLSGEDRPVVDLATWERQLENATFDFISTGQPITEQPSFGHPPGSMESAFTRGEYKWQCLTLPKSFPPIANNLLFRLAWLSRYCQTVFTMEYSFVRKAWFFGWPRRRRHLPSGWRLYRGESWMAFNRKAAEVVLNASPETRAHFKKTFIPIETYFHTILWNQPGVVPERKRYMYVPWKYFDKSPSVLLWIKKDYFEEIRRSPVVFARKFNPDIDSEVISMFDEAIDRSRSRIAEMKEKHQSHGATPTRALES